MEYPIFDVPLLGGSLLIAGVAIVHVFISHFSVGAGFMMASAERQAIREGDSETRGSLKKYGFMVLLIPYVLGTVTGVGIWFTIALVNPRAVSILTHQFVWDWAIEWVLFLIEGTAIYLYVFYWDRMRPKAHNRLGWIFAFTSLGTLFIINGILSFMLTPGQWKPGDAGMFNYKALLNPTYLPTSLARVLISLALAGVAAVVLSAFDRKMPEASRRKLAARGYKFIVPAVLCLPLGCWTVMQLSERAQTFLAGGAPVIVIFMGLSAAALLILFFAAALSLYRKDFAPSTLGAVLLALLAFVGFGASEFVREGLRKPFVIEGFMYSTGVTAESASGVDIRANIAQTAQDGVLMSAPWALPADMPLDELNQAKLGELDQMVLGEAVFRAACLRCHSVEGYNAIRPLVASWSAQTLRSSLNNLDELKPAMPPFPGTTAEKDALAAYLLSLNADEEDDAVESDEPDPLARGEAVYRDACRRCHSLDGHNAMRPLVGGSSTQSLRSLMDHMDEINSSMPPFSGSDSDKDDLVVYLQSLNPTAD
ncbi:MAG: c-type cytochrome [Planctomycetota bacterium]|jgi:cytochrome bd-type quinol oxidase subunit 1/mono/diheme cytochrome c family protein